MMIETMHMSIYYAFLALTFGGVVYVTRFPESHFPGKFDIWFGSHQIWHLFINASVYFTASVRFTLPL
jgi:predicted membrane channel-forming protein YqfA (hemolysin III family)